MRISDWSSDVCSSDLPGRLPGRAGEGGRPCQHHLPLRARRRLRGGSPGQRADRIRRRDAHRRQPVRRPEGRVLRQILMLFFSLPCEGRGGQGRGRAGTRAPNRKPVTATERKSVVSGTSASVRLDLGGRRIIQKKTKKLV